jgi:ADP-heptose:LPS heptosyltransferase
VRSTADVLAHLPLARRIAAVGAVALGRAIATASRAGSSGQDRDVLVAFASLGDQLRMLNVWSRFAPSDRPVDVICNSETADAFAIYQGVGARRAYGFQGAAALAPAACGVWQRRKQYRRAIVAHPFVTQPIALAYARVRAQSVASFEGRSFGRHRPGDIATPLGTTSWRDAYEALFAACYGAPKHLRPVLTPAASADRDRCRHDARSRPPVVVMHVGASTPARSLPARLCVDAISALRARGYEITILGSEAERVRLANAFDASGARLMCGSPLREIVGIVAGASFFFGVDSSMLHVADAVGTPCVVVYLATQPAVTGPFYTRFEAVYPRTDYRPVGMDAMTRWRDFSAGRDVEIDDLLRAFDRIAAR